MARTKTNKRFSKKQIRNSKRRQRKKTMKGGMFTGNFETYLSHVPSNAYIPFNVDNGGNNDPIAPINLYPSRLDAQVPTTPVYIGGGSRRKTKKQRNMKGGQGMQPILSFFSGSNSDTVSNNPVYSAINTNNAPTLAQLSSGTGKIVTSDLTVQPVVVSPASSFRSALI